MPGSPAAGLDRVPPDEETRSAPSNSAAISSGRESRVIQAAGRVNEAGGGPAGSALASPAAWAGSAPSGRHQDDERQPGRKEPVPSALEKGWNSSIHQHACPFLTLHASFYDMSICHRIRFSATKKSPNLGGKDVPEKRISSSRIPGIPTRTPPDLQKSKIFQ